MGLWYPKDFGFELTAFLDADHAGCLDTCKSNYRGIQFLGDKLVSWMSKKQDYVSMSMAEAEYVVQRIENKAKMVIFRCTGGDRRRVTRANDWLAEVQSEVWLIEAMIEASRRGDAIIVPPVLACHFELKIGLLNLVTAISFHGFENDDPHSHIRRSGPDLA
ncbi:hypothetical protein Tco_0973195 [Tanacetum coccineum]